MEIKIKAISSFSTQGCLPLQEDRILSLQETGIFAVADGFGGKGAGFRAAQISCDSVKAFLVKEAGDEEATLPFELRPYFSLAGNILFNSLIFANRQVNAENQGRKVEDRGGASLVAAYLDGAVLSIANVGCCSAFLVRDGHLTELALPRSFARMCDPFAVETDWTRQVPLMALGMSESLEPEMTEYRLREGDWVWFQSDGVGGGTRCRLPHLQQEGASPTQSAETWVQWMKAQKFVDNASGLLLIL